jgi:hypothetical protein
MSPRDESGETNALIVENLKYDPETGVILWLKDKGRGRTGKEAGCPRNPENGHVQYRSIGINGLHLSAHRIAWFLHYEEWPNAIDHINGDGLDNRITNLRNVTRVENAKNSCMYANNTSGVLGVSWHKHRKKWEVRISNNGKSLNIGCFIDIEDAKKARAQAEIKYGYHPNHGRKRTAYSQTEGKL